MTPVAKEGEKATFTQGSAQKSKTGQVWLTNQVRDIYDLNLLPSPRTSDTNGPGLHGTGGMDLWTTVSLLPTTTAMDYKASGGAEGSSNVTLTDAVVRGRGLLPTPDASVANDGEGVETWEARRELVKAKAINGNGMGMPLTIAAQKVATNWGPYEPAIRRWEHVNGPAPAPTEPNAKGGHRLSPWFTEWMMGVPKGWICDVDISRNDKLKAAGNGVVPQQATAALKDMLTALTEQEAAA
jgi:DNA (cytosine-5)-methyltransferase 1